MDELEKLALSDEQKIGVAAFVAAAVEAAVAEATQGLDRKNKELLGKVAKSPAAKRLGELENELEELKSAKEQEEAERSQDYAKAKEAMEKRHAEALAKLTERAEKAEGQLASRTKRSLIEEQMNRVNVATALRGGVAAMYEGKVDLQEDGSALIDGKPVEDFFTEFAKSDAGKAYIAAPGSSGSGAKGGGPPGEGPNPFAKDHLNVSKQAEIFRQDPDRARALAKQAGVSLAE